MAHFMKNEDLGIPGECCYNRPINGVWTPNNSLAIHGLGDPARRGTSSSYNGESNVLHLMMQPDYKSVYVRQLVHELACIFNSNQRSEEQQMTIAEVLHYSRSYRAVLKAAIQECLQSLDGEDELAERHLRCLTISESAWSLIEIIFLQEPLGGELVQQLMSWLREHNTGYQKKIEEILREDLVEGHEDYWSVVYDCALQGRTEEVVTLLQSANTVTQPIAATIDILKKMPVYQSSSSTVAEFKRKWQLWQQEVRQILEEAVFITSEKLTQLVQVLSGNEEAIAVMCVDLKVTWYSYLLADTFYRQPFAKLNDIQKLINVCIEATGGHTEFESHDHLVLAVLKKSLLEVMKHSTEQFTSWWYAAHLADVFNQAGYLHEKNSLGTSMVEGILLEYGASLMQDDSMWPLGIKYLLKCPTRGKEQLQEYLGHISLGSTKKALKVLSVCEQHGFTQQANSICRVMARKCLSQDRLGSALTWCRHSKDSYMATVVAERFLEKYRNNQILDSADVLEALGSTMLLSKNLLFLAKFREFFQLCDIGEEAEACSLIVNLISSRMAPKRYWFCLMLELLPFLEAPKLLFTTQQVYDMMNSLTELKQSKTIEMEDSLEVSRVRALQNGLTRCLARATLSDPTSLLGIPM